MWSEAVEDDSEHSGSDLLVEVCVSGGSRCGDE
jgi:hypothetical protein